MGCTVFVDGLRDTDDILRFILYRVLFSRKKCSISSLDTNQQHMYGGVYWNYVCLILMWNIDEEKRQIEAFEIFYYIRSMNVGCVDSVTKEETLYRLHEKRTIWSTIRIRRDRMITRMRDQVALYSRPLKEQPKGTETFIYNEKVVKNGTTTGRCMC